MFRSKTFVMMKLVHSLKNVKLKQGLLTRGVGINLIFRGYI